MRIFQQSQEREDLKKIEEGAFVDDCKEQFTEKSLADTNRAKVKTLTLLSYLPNILSAVTAGFFVLYLLSGYALRVAVVLGALLLLIVVAIEVGKRYLIASSAKDRYTIGKVSPLAIGALILLFGASMTGSYFGGKALVVETAAPPDRPHNPEIDSLKNLLAAELATIERLQKTTWKGKVTSDAVKGINASKRVQTSLTDRIMSLEAASDTQHTTLLEKHTAKHLNFGYILGALAALADVFLLGMIWAIWHLRYQVAAVHAARSSTAQGATTVNFPGAYNTQNPAHLNETARPGKIGFHAQRDDDNDNRNNDNRSTKIVNENRISEGNRICEHCGTAYQYRHAKQKFCSEQCRIASWSAATGRKLHKGKARG